MHQRQKGGGEQENWRGEGRAMDPVYVAETEGRLCYTVSWDGRLCEAVAAWDRDWLTDWLIDWLTD